MTHVTTPDRIISNGIDSDFKNTRFLLSALLCLCITLFSGTTYAKGSVAGTRIANTVIVNYKVDGEVQIPIESSPEGNTSPGIGNGQAITFVVDRKIDLTLTGNSNANVSAGDRQAGLTFTLINEGNDSQEFSLIPDNTLNTDDFDSSNCTTSVTALSGTPLPGVTLPTSGNIKLKADQQARVRVQCDIPETFSGNPVVYGNTSLVSLYATAEKNMDGSPVQQSQTADSSSNIETVFADSNGPDDASRDATFTARRTYTVTSTSADLVVEKSILSTIDPQGGNQSISGAKVTYKISINTTGTGFIDNLVITDPSPPELTYQSGSIYLDNIRLTDNNDADNADFGKTSANTATIHLGSIAAGSQHEIRLSYIIN